MSAIVDFEWYSTVYMGQTVDQTQFPALCARAADVVGAMTRWQVTEDNFTTLPAFIRTLYQKAICAQVDYFGVNGLDSVDDGMERGWTVGKVSVSGKSGSDIRRTGAMEEHIAPMARMYLEQTGLTKPSVAVLRDMPMVGWW